MYCQQLAVVEYHHLIGNVVRYRSLSALIPGQLPNKNMFIRPTEEELENFEPDFIVYNASKAKVENYKELGLNSETAVVFNLTSHTPDSTPR